MNAEKPKDFELELLEAQGGNISSDQFGDLLSHLKKSRSLDHIGWPVRATKLGELDMVYIVLRKGFIYEYDENGFFTYTGVSKNDTDYWLAGFGSLRLSNAGQEDSTAELVVSLLPRAQKFGCGQYLVQKLVEYAFETLRIRRVTAPIVCPVQPYYTASTKKQVLLNTKQLCWMFEKFGFMFEGVTRGAVKGVTAAEGGEPVWHDVHRMSMLEADYFDEVPYLLSSTCWIRREGPESRTKTSPWDSMIRRQEEEKQDLDSWNETSHSHSATPPDEAFYEDEEGQDSDDDTVLGGDDDSDWEIPEDS